MRDEKDPGTLEMHLPRKRGRPAKFGVAMSDAQRAAEYRVRRRFVRDGGNRNLPGLNDTALLDKIRAAISEGAAAAAVGRLVGELARRYPEK